ncbi:hypothetical protein EYF80_042949 [Liparis tanakae]|uniref:Uncharacterized protein n=1 Tax=Liparis tanakae TaxID=230148 RepID=A0A4Z2G117_9TELE|nr:hypothetical protein EYF80_042949 [Liparis tanakae]
MGPLDAPTGTDEQTGNRRPVEDSGGPQRPPCPAQDLFGSPLSGNGGGLCGGLSDRAALDPRSHGATSSSQQNVASCIAVERYGQGEGATCTA